MVYGQLPFQPIPQGANLFSGEPVAFKGKRIVSAFIDYGLGLLFLLYAKIRAVTSYGWGTSYGPGDLFFESTLWWLPILAMINIGIVQGAYGQSLGKFLTRTTLVAQARRRPEVAGVYRGIMRIGVPLALAFFAYSDFRGNDFQDSDAVGSVVFVLLFLSYALAIFDPKGRTFWDHVCKTGAIDVVIRERNAENDKPAPNVRRQNPM